ncbi:MAG: polysaccharide pyruvyl transferase family protein [Actinobacteria bacterium]|nr:polysaccharide pyruvyl transferase family protein [Actinomycetota bacterium]
MKYVIVGPALSGNMGAASMVTATVRTIGERDREAEITLLSYYPDEDRRQGWLPELRVLDARPARLGTLINGGAVLWRVLPPLRKLIARKVPEVAAIAEADVVLDQGGIAFSDGREKFLVFNVAILLPALVLGRPVVKCAQALGPFRSRINRWTARAILPRIDLIVARGAKTREFLDGLRLDNVELGTDLAFMMGVPTEEEVAGRGPVDEALARLAGPQLTVGIAPSVVVKAKVEAAGGDFDSMMVAVVERQLAAGRRVLLVPHSFRSDPTKTHNNDGPLVNAIAARIDHPDLVVVREQMDPEELRYLIGRCDAFVSCRFHAMVSSLSMGVPTLVLGWSHKYVEVLDLFGQADRSIDAAALDADGIGGALERLIDDREAVRAAIDAAQPAVRALSGAQIDRILEIARSS